MSQREYKEHYVVQDSREHLATALARAATTHLLEVTVLGDEGSAIYRVHEPEPHYWPTDELSHIKGRSDSGDQINISVSLEHGELPTMYVWADER